MLLAQVTNVPEWLLIKGISNALASSYDDECGEFAETIEYIRTNWETFSARCKLIIKKMVEDEINNLGIIAEAFYAEDRALLNSLMPLWVNL